MTVLNSNLANAWTPEDYGKAIDLVVDAESIAFLVATVTNTDKHTIRFPILVDDAATGWVPEKGVIPLTDPETDELVVTPTKVAGRVELSNESVMDSDPEVLDETAKGLGRSLSKRIDSAFFGDTITNGPSGLLSLTDAQVVDAGAFINLDPFHDAKLQAFNNNAELTHFVLAPDVANTLAKVKTASGSNAGLLETVDDGVRLAGVPVYVSRAVAPGNAWGLDKRQIRTVRRLGTTIVADGSASFDSDATQLRATSRVGFGFANPAGIVRLHDAA
ncbi:phage major capsid protein [Rhodococcus gordoniae]|uniref:phage major capsid protein n=1 Tax=Rhodococcus gordoniae TaxID=223392 RepID=UPI0020CFE5CB|nr:phage major capsid protein [Rhodococcus gordoniae]UTT48922.1 phage major capsid protein [Rhodococcus gordoniae]